MQAVEFETQLKGGDIKIPDTLKDVHSAHARVIVLFEENSSQATSEQKSFEKSGFAQQVLLNPSEDIWDRVL